MKRIVLLMLAVCMMAVPVMGAPPAAGDWQLIWSDEFDSGPTPIPPDSSNWGHEIGYVRNQEWQYYTNNIQNAYCQDGFLHIEAHQHPPGTYPTGGYTGQDGSISSASIRSMNKVAHKYGYLEIRARVDTRLGSWPAFWSLGVSGGWPDGGECDILEYYTGKFLFNVAWWKTGDGPWSPRWDGEKVYLASLPSGWLDDFHNWAMEWNTNEVKLYLDEVLINYWDSSQDDNGGGDVSVEGFQQAHYMLINQAIGGTAGGDASGLVYPTSYEVDYVRWYQDFSDPSPYIPVGHWKLDESHPSSIAIDSSINGYDGTLYGGPVWDSNGQIDGAIRLDGIDDYVKITGWRGVSGSNSRTVCAWIKTDMTSVGEIVSWGGTGNGGKWLLMILSTGELRLAVTGGGIKSTTQINDGNWHHVAAAFENDGSPDVSDVKLYIDGIEESTTSSSQAIDTASYYKVKIGAWFDGLIDDVRIYKTALSRDQILFIMEGGSFEYNRYIYVDDDATGTNDGSSWQDAFNHLQDALDVAQFSDQIWVAEGIYRPDENTNDPCGTGDRNATFGLINGVAVYGGFAGYGAPDPNARDIELYETILSGDLNGDDVGFTNNGENSYHVVTGSETNATAGLDGFTITAGNANGPTQNHQHCGGGMLNWDNGSPSLINCTFSGNLAEDLGGGMSNLGNCSPTLTNCTFSGNSAGRAGGMSNQINSNPTLVNCTFSGNSPRTYGGGMYNYQSSPTLNNCTFSGNSAGEMEGGGMYNEENSSPELTNCTFSDNSAEVGGGMYNSESSPELFNCTFSGNSAGGWGGGGGGMYNQDGSSPTLTNCTFSGNSAGGWEGGGGGMYNKSSSPTITNCTFSGNSVSGGYGKGGGMRNESNSSPTLTNCTFSGNSSLSSSGGGMCNESNSSPTLTNCTFSGNSVEYHGGGMANYNSSPTVTNCIFSGNSADGSGGGMYNFLVSSPTVTNCTFTGNSANLGGGGMSNGSGSPTITNCTFSGNGAKWGGGMYNWNGSSPTVNNCILWGNTASSGGNEIYNYDTSSIPVISYCDIAGCGSSGAGWDDDLGDDGGGNIDADPLFINVSNDDLRLLPDSPCIDAGDNTAVPAGVTTDLDGNPRIRGTIVDMGAYESPAVLFVDVDAAGANDGSSWQDAYNYLQDALSTEWWFDEIRVAQGTYKPDQSDGITPGDRQATFYLKNGVAIKGGYAGSGEPDPDARDIELYETILSGDLDGNDGADFANNGENSYHVVTGSGTNPNAVLDGFTIKAGNANGSWWLAKVGGGMYNESGSPTVTNCTFIGNLATWDGGGMYNLDYSSPTLNNCTFSGNSAKGEAGGAGMYNDNSSPSLTNCTFSGNSAGGDGGGMDNYESSPTLTDCTFSGNLAQWSGGMNNGKNSSPELTNCTFSGNSAEWQGGGMGNDRDSNPTVTNCIFSNNSAGDAGGGMANFSGSSPTLTDCTFSGNSVEWDGGGMYNDQSSPTLNNCTFSGNSAGRGGGMYNLASSPTLTNCTFSGNLTPWDGAGMCNWYNSSPTLNNCNFSNNSAEYYSGGGMFNLDQSNPTLTNCTFSNNSAGDGGGGMGNQENSRPTVTNCTFIGNSAGRGGGMNNGGNCNPELTNCTFSDNSAGEAGGGIDCYYSNPAIINCTFIGNSAKHGGGMHNHHSSSTLTNCTFSGNSSEYGGGGMNNWDYSSPTLTGCMFTGNSADGGGGMVSGLYSNPTLTNCTFSGNSARWNGGGVSNNNNSSSTLTNCILWGNSGQQGSQIHNDWGCSTTVSYSDVQGGWPGEGNIEDDPMFVGPKIGEPPEGAIAHWKLNERRGSTAYDSAGENDGTVFGAQWTTGKADGALSFDGSDDWVNISNPGTISSESDFTWVAWIQTSSDTGAILARAGTGWAWERGGKVFFLWGGRLHFDVGWVGVVSSGVPVNDGQWHYVVVTVEFVNGSDTISFYVDGVSAGGGNLNVDRFSDSGLPLKIGFCNGNFPESCHFNGKIDDVRIYDRALSAEEIQQFYQSKYHLLPTSPCIDAGDNTAVPAGITTDLDGNPRFVDQPEVPDTGNGTAPIVDMGAYEADYIEVAMRLTPQALNLDSQGKWLKAHLVLPEGFLPEDVNANIPAVIEPFGIESDHINVFINEDGLVEIEAAFGRSDFCSSTTSDDVTELIVIGLLNDGRNFYGTDTIKIITKDLAVLAYYWLESDCGPPDWCAGLDFDRDSVVNFVDFALFDSCCIEIIEE